MASWTDAITQFNPYVSTLPVEAMVKVGMEKQKRYDEGYKKIQGEIDKVAGLDVVRDVDKEYLQSKLNELGGSMRTFAASDFSNYQLVNSVAGMTKQVAGDQDVQNAVSNTALYRKESKKMEEAKRDGKSNIANEDLFSTQASGWLNGKSVKDKFNAQYVPYKDVFKKLGEIAKSVGEDSTIVQQLFQTDKNGNPVLVNGKMQYNDVMAETLLKGKDKNKILQAFQTGLDADDYRQLNISGRYNLKGKSKEELTGLLDQGFAEYEKGELLRKDFIEDKIIELTTKGGDKAIVDKLKEQVALIDNNINKRKQSVDNLKALDEDAIRGNIYTNNYIDSLASAFSTKETYTKYLKNPAVEVMMDREKMKLDVNKFKFEQDKFEYQKIHDREQMSQERWKALFEKGLVDENGRPTGAGLYTGPARDLGLKDYEGTYFIEQFQKGLEDDMASQFGMYEKITLAAFMTTNSGKTNPNTGKAFTEDEMKTQIRAHANKVGMSYNDYVVLQGQKATDKYNSTKGQYLGAEYAQTFQSINQLGQSIGLKKKQIDSEKNVVSSVLGGEFIDVSKIDIKPVTVTAVLGGAAEGRGKLRRENVTLSKQDVLDFASFIYHDSEGGLPGFLDSAEVKDQARVAKERLIKKYGTSGFESIQTDLRGSDMRIVSFNPRMRNINQNEEVKKAIDVIKSSNYVATTKAREQYYKNLSQVGAPKGVVLYKDKPETQRHLASALVSIADEYSDIDSDFTEIAALANDEKAQFQINITPAASRYGKNTYELQVTDAEGDITIKTIKEKDYNYLTGKSAPSLLVNDAVSAATYSQYGSTNLGHYYTDDNAYSTAFVKDYETKTSDKYNVAIDYVMSGENQFYPKIYVQLGEDNWKMFPYNAPINDQGVINFPSQVDDVFVKSLLQKNSK
jgi:hypothetical protein